MSRHMKSQATDRGPSENSLSMSFGTTKSLIHVFSHHQSKTDAGTAFEKRCF
jgi:hypothetical protein